MADYSVTQLKICTKCGDTKPLNAFYKNAKCKSGSKSRCIDCCNAVRRSRYSSDPELGLKRRQDYTDNAARERESARKWRIDNLDRARENGKRWSRENPELKRQLAASWREKNSARVLQYSKDYHNQNREEILERRSVWRDENREYVRARDRAYMAANPEIRKKIDAKRRSTPKGRLSHSVQTAIHRYITKGSKAGRRSFELLGYTADDLMAHLEKLFLPGMSWENYGQWHVDHKIPLAAFNYEDPSHIDFKRAWELNNLQPLWAIDNSKKRAKLVAPFQPSLAI